MIRSWLRRRRLWRAFLDFETFAPDTISMGTREERFRWFCILEAVGPEDVRAVLAAKEREL